MRALNMVAVAVAFAVIFASMVLVSAFFTSALHGQLQSRATPVDYFIGASR